MNALHAVITGDVVASTDMTAAALSALPGALEETYQALRVALPEHTRFAITGGDGWQLFVAAPHAGLRAALMYRARLWSTLAIETRLALAIDTVDTLRDDLNASNGSAFQRSGRALQSLAMGEKKHDGKTYLPEQQMVCMLPEHVPSVENAYGETLGLFADHLARGWTEAQAQAVAAMLMHKPGTSPPTLHEVGEAWNPGPITKQAVSKHLKNAKWDQVNDLLLRFEQLIAHLTIPEVEDAL